MVCLLGFKIIGEQAKIKLKKNVVQDIFFFIVDTLHIVRGRSRPQNGIPAKE